VALVHFKLEVLMAMLCCSCQGLIDVLMGLKAHVAVTRVYVSVHFMKVFIDLCIWHLPSDPLGGKFVVYKIEKWFERLFIMRHRVRVNSKSRLQVQHTTVQRDKFRELVCMQWCFT
jgi:hypothetical protein